MDDIIRTDVEHRQRMERGSDWLRRGIDYARSGSTGRVPSKSLPPRDLMWGSQQTGGPNWQPGTESTSRKDANARVAAKLAEKDRTAELHRISRDACPLCAVRADIGCKHTKPSRLTSHEVLHNPEHVNRAWDREVELAKLGNRR